MTSARAIALLATGLLSGIWGMGWYALLPASEPMSASEYTRFHQILNERLVLVLPVLSIAAIASAATIVVVGRRERDAAFTLTAIGLALTVAATVVTLANNVPINSEIARWSIEHPPAEWADVVSRWNLGHKVRTACVMVAFGLHTLAAVRR